jgi:hypothetical protein
MPAPTTTSPTVIAKLLEYVRLTTEASNATAAFQAAQAARLDAIVALRQELKAIAAGSPLRVVKAGKLLHLYPEGYVEAEDIEVQP